MTGVDLSGDMQVAKVYLSILSDERGKEIAMDNLSRLEGYVRKRLAKEMQLRMVPDIRFVQDNAIERGMRVLRLLDQIKQQEEGTASFAAPPIALPGDDDHDDVEDDDDGVIYLDDEEEEEEEEEESEEVVFARVGETSTSRPPEAEMSGGGEAGVAQREEQLAALFGTYRKRKGAQSAERTAMKARQAKQPVREEDLVPEKYRSTYTSEDALRDAEFMAMRQAMGQARGKGRSGGKGSKGRKW